MKCILFWSLYNKEIDLDGDMWVNRIASLSPLHYLSLISHLKNGNEVHLYSYQQIKNLPTGIILKDADEILPKEFAYNALLSGHSIAHISDIIRLTVASENQGVVIDMDAVVLRPFPKQEGFFASMPAKQTGGFAPKWGNSHPPLIINDNSWDGKALSAFPMGVDKKMAPYIRNLVYSIFTTLSRPPEGNSKAWNYVLWTIKKLPSLDKKYIVYKPLYFCPLPAWLSAGKCYSLESPTRLDGKTELFGHTLPSIEQILDNSYVVQHFFESAFQKAKLTEDDFWLTVKDGSLLAREAEFIMGDDWRKLLYEA